MQLRFCLIAANSLTAVLLLARVAAYAPLLAQPGARSILAEAFALIFVYLLAAILLTTSRRARDLAYAETPGLIAAALQFTHVLAERFVRIPSGWEGPTTAAFMLSTFACWAIAAFRARRAALPKARCILISIAAAILTMSLAVCAGTALELYIAPAPLQSMRYWAEYTRSGWNDLQAFAIANTADSIVSHLLIAPVIATIVGALAILAASAARANKRRLSSP